MIRIVFVLIVDMNNNHNEDENNHLRANVNNAVPENRYIQDLDGWLQFNGLRAPAAHAEEKLDLQEERRRFQESDSYQASIHHRIFAETDHQREEQHRQRMKRLESWEAVRMDFLTADGGVIADVQLRPLAESCDTVFCLAASRESFSSTGDDETSNLTLSLERFPKSSVIDFIDVCFERRTCSEISSESIVDCCQIAHYVQNTRVLQETVNILMESIDTANCLPMSQLADQLNLPLLFERSLSHMINTIGDLEANDAWGDLTPELQERILTIKGAIQSSLHSSSSRRLYFSSLDEYLAIFAERVQYYRERLAEARDQQLETAPNSPGWRYAQQKIDHQEERVKTLENALQEQKKLFRQKGLAFSSGCKE